VAAGAGDAAKDALSQILPHYWYPLYAWARRRGMQPADAADAVQRFLEWSCESNLLAKAREERGRLRAFLMTCFQRHLIQENRKATNQRRGGGILHIAVDWDGAEALYRSEPTLCQSPEALYARTWAISLMEEALVRLEAHYQSTGRAALHDALLPALESTLPDDTFAALAPTLGMQPGTLRSAAARFRQRYRRILLELAAERLGITSEVALKAELHSLLGAKT